MYVHIHVLKMTLREWRYLANPNQFSWEWEHPRLVFNGEVLCDNGDGLREAPFQGLNHQRLVLKLELFHVVEGVSNKVKMVRFWVRVGDIEWFESDRDSQARLPSLEIGVLGNEPLAVDEWHDQGVQREKGDCQVPNIGVCRITIIVNLFSSEHIEKTAKHAPFKGLQPRRIDCLGTTEIQGHRQVWRARRRCPRTPSRTTDANLDCAFVENALFYIDPWFWKVNRIELS